MTVHVIEGAVDNMPGDRCVRDSCMAGAFSHSLAANPPTCRRTVRSAHLRPAWRAHAPSLLARDMWERIPPRPHVHACAARGTHAQHFPRLDHAGTNATLNSSTPIGW